MASRARPDRGAGWGFPSRRNAHWAHRGAQPRYLLFLGGYVCGPGIASPAAVFPVCQVYVPYTDTTGLVYGSNVHSSGAGWSVNPPGALAVDTDVLGLVGVGYDEWAIFTAERSSVPEPMTLTLVGLGLAGVGFMRRRKTS